MSQTAAAAAVKCIASVQALHAFANQPISVLVPSWFCSKRWLPLLQLLGDVPLLLIPPLVAAHCARHQCHHNHMMHPILQLI